MRSQRGELYTGFWATGPTERIYLEILSSFDLRYKQTSPGERQEAFIESIGAAFYKITKKKLLAVALDATKVKPIPTAATIARLASTFFIIDPYSPFSENRNNSTFCNDEEI